MINLFENSSTGKICFAIFWTIGTLLFISFYLTEQPALIFAGLIYVVLSVAINFTFLIVEILKIILDEHRAEHLKSAGYILLNIPFAMLYLTILINSKI